MITPDEAKHILDNATLWNGCSRMGVINEDGTYHL